MPSLATPAQGQLRTDARAFAARWLTQVPELIAPHATPEARFLATRPIYAEAIQAGFLRRLIPAPFGGEGTSNCDLAIVAEEFYAVDGSVSLTLLATMLGLSPLFIAGSPQQVQSHLGPFLSAQGTPLASLASSEPGGSANFLSPAPAEGLRTTAVLKGDVWHIQGKKHWVSVATGWEGEGADLVCALARSGTDAAGKPEATMFAIEAKKNGGVILDEAIPSLGHRGHLAPRFSIDATVGSGAIIGPRGAGKTIADGAFTGTAAVVGMFATGLMRAAFSYALDFARRERRGGLNPIIEYQAVADGLSHAKARIEAVRALSWAACQALDTMRPGAAELALHAKVYGSETAVEVITSLMRVVGVDSYSEELPLGRYLLDALALPVFDGGNLGVRLRSLQGILSAPGYSPLHAPGIA